MDEFDTQCRTRLAEILAVYEMLGYPSEMVTRWSIPATDVTDLWRLAKNSSAKRVLEVGSFVGTSTFLLAQALPEAIVHSVDPNLALSVEFTAMGAAGHGADLSRRTLEVADLAATRLGLGSRTKFHEGGFAVGQTFALHDRPISVIGPALCQQHGPFGFVFIDGLHFENAVVADLRLALSALEPDGIVALHDVIGYWGSHVRRGVARVLEEDQSLSFDHAPYHTMDRSIGTVSRIGGVPSALETRLKQAFEDGNELAAHLARLLRSTFPSAQFEGRDVFATEICGHLQTLAKADSPRVVIAIDAIDAVVASRQEAALEALAQGADALVLGFTPPGERGAAAAWSRPLALRVRQLAAMGYDTYDLIYPFLEPYTFAYGGGSALQRKTSFLLDAVIAVRRGSALALPLSIAQPLQETTARALTDLRLQLLGGACRAGYLRSNYDSLRADYDSLRADYDSLRADHDSRRRGFWDFRRKA
jgi:predicted O-methyltransferase YrrM